MTGTTFHLIHSNVVVAAVTLLLFLNHGFAIASPLPKAMPSQYIGTWEVIAVDTTLPVIVYGGTWAIGREYVRIGSLMTTYEVRGGEFMAYGVRGISFRVPVVDGATAGRIESFAAEGTYQGKAVIFFFHRAPRLRSPTRSRKN